MRKGFGQAGWAWWWVVVGLLCFPMQWGTGRAEQGRRGAAGGVSVSPSPRCGEERRVLLPGRPDRTSSGDEAGRIMLAPREGGDIFFLSSRFVLPLLGERAGVRGTAGTAPVLAITGISPSSAASRHLPPGGRWPSRLNFADGTGPLRLCLWQNHFPREAGAENRAWTIHGRGLEVCAGRFRLTSQAIGASPWLETTRRTFLSLMMMKWTAWRSCAGCGRWSPTQGFPRRPHPPTALKR